MEPKFVLHGGAGSWDKNEEKAQKEIEKIADQINEKKNSLKAVDIVEEAVRKLEECKYFNAGKGAKKQLDGEFRLDASIMKSNLETGAVIGIEDEYLHPVSIAKTVMNDTHHLALKGRQASEFASKHGFKQANLETSHRNEELKEGKEKLSGLEFKDKIKKLREIEGSGTVGAVALDSEGCLAAATSTGGVNNQLKGRVGDTPMPGCGTYCNENAAVSATGHGEAIIKSTLSRRTAENIEKGLKPERANKKALNFLEERTSSYAGLVTIDKDGNTSGDFNSDSMVYTER